MGLTLGLAIAVVLGDWLHRPHQKMLQWVRPGLVLPEMLAPQQSEYQVVEKN
jgi:hypothetical protein